MTIVENVATRRQVKPLIMLLADVSVTIWLVLLSILIKLKYNALKAQLHLNSIMSIEYMLF